MIIDRVHKLQTELPVLITGDFNAVAGRSKTHEILVNSAAFTDTWPLARLRINEKLNSFHNFGAPGEEGLRIDWILARGSLTVDKTEIITFSENGQSPSDHFPVAAWLNLEPAK